MGPDPSLPVYKMPHLQAWSMAPGQYALPAVGLHQLLWVDTATLDEAGRTDLHGQPVFAVARPDMREVWMSVRDEDRIEIRDVRSHAVTGEIAAHAPLGIFFTDRAHRAGL